VDNVSNCKLGLLANRSKNILPMSYNQNLAEKIRHHLIDIPNLEEKEMFGGIAFMVNGKMCVGLIKDDMMCRMDPDLYADVLERNGCREMDFTGRPMKGWVLIEESGFSRAADFHYWIQLALDYNSKAKKSVKKKIKK
jgi:TfoX/Sxy family transcriptional regulator of competence genes